MNPKTLVVRTKLVPPRLHRRILHRERLSVLLAAALDYRLTILQAGAGYGKTTALAALQEGETPLAWYHLSVEDCDPLVFLLHLIYCFDGSLPGVGRSLAALLESESAEAPLQSGPGVVDALANELAGQLTRPMLVVLDDVHRLRETPDVLGLLDRLIERAPADVHFLFSSRYPVRLPSLVTWKARGEGQ